MYELNKNILERYLRVNLLGPGPRLLKKRIYRAAVSQKLRNSDIGYVQGLVLKQVQKAYVWGSLFSALTSTV